MRMKLMTFEQLLDNGWSYDSVGSLIHPTACNNIATGMFMYLGQEIDVEPSSLDRPEFRFAGFGWPFEMFKKSKTPKSTKKKVNPFIKQFANADLLTARGMIRCGFELETQETEGYCAAGSFNEEAYDEAVSEYAYEQASDLYEVNSNQLHGGDFLDNLNPEQFYKVMRTLGIDSLSELCELTGDDEGEVMEHYYDEARQSIDRDEYCTDSGEDNIDVPDNMVIGHDQSVRGFEFATAGARTYAEFIRAASDIYKLNHEIDVGCSFHIHLSIHGVHHMPGAQLTKRMTEYILDRQHELPESVRERFRAGNKFYKPRLDPHEKFAFVRRHPGYKTWEFRCFGNVTNARDAKICLDMALAALQYAYQCKDSKSAMLGDSLYDAEWVDLATRAMMENVSLSDLLIGARENAA